ncbi:type II toxin-antitoxin system RelE/ParE family toxin [Rhodobacteraceae bacterium N5(2021)]|uniref:Toxin n=1 Tax=Gymnodinialimonas phycosphaerae TaxID=2841589 RepID=A0A975YEY7_9RHOB|nr:type II toxin-antitoxin system RelE/ParE family toxin [Gymnodinialimonas phycosphaerae]
MKRIDYAADATADIADIWDYTEERWGYDQAVKYDAKIEDRIVGVASGRVASRSADEIAPELRRALAGSHVVFFREDEVAVTVVRVLHQRMDVGWV